MDHGIGDSTEKICEHYHTVMISCSQHTWTHFCLTETLQFVYAPALELCYDLRKNIFIFLNSMEGGGSAKMELNNF